MSPYPRRHPQAFDRPGRCPPDRNARRRELARTGSRRSIRDGIAHPSVKVKSPWHRDPHRAGVRARRSEAREPCPAAAPTCPHDSLSPTHSCVRMHHASAQGGRSATCVATTGRLGTYTLRRSCRGRKLMTFGRLRTDRTAPRPDAASPIASPKVSMAGILAGGARGSVTDASLLTRFHSLRTCLNCVERIARQLSPGRMAYSPRHEVAA